MTMPRISAHMVKFVAGAMLAAVVAGCSTASPPNAGAQQAVFATPGEYPNLNVPPQPAREQISDAKKAADTAELRARRAQAGASAATRVPDTSSELRRIAQSHGNAALAEIENE
ncbi:hypothetical protein [Mesorhizobium sp. CAU 1732]|uniref:hypothetical protein n=1 Tax=Mesorhizobium sp. CAU 1732 TaxID=3140358 RepID=UPI003260E27C